MPSEILESEKFLEIANSLATSCRVKKSGDVVKLKLRTPKTLYTYKTDAKEADSLIAKLEIEILEL